MSINSFLVTLFSAIGEYMFIQGKGNSLLLLPFAFAGYSFSRVWYSVLTSYNIINSARWNVVYDMEGKFLCNNKPFHSEWHDQIQHYEQTAIMLRGFSWLWQTNWSQPRYYAISRMERELPRIFGRIYILLGIGAIGFSESTIEFWKTVSPKIISGIISFCKDIWRVGLGRLEIVIPIFIILMVIALRLPNKRKESAEDS